jgi:hypothetical protein
MQCTPMPEELEGVVTGVEERCMAW